MSEQHKPVLLSEVLTGLAIKPDGVYIDGTFGRGGHSKAILEILSSKGRLIAIDKDLEAVGFAEKTLGKDKRFSIIHGSFNALEKIAEHYGVCGKVDGVLLDLGVSSPQLDVACRGFSFLQDGPLDMRMNTQQGITAAEWINQAKEKEIADVLFELGEERFARRIAKAIVHERALEPIVTTGRLAAIASAANPRWEEHKHPATRTFQAIRIFINQELNELEDVLSQIVEVLGAGGRLTVISFHSLEDRIVKRFIRKSFQGEALPIELPVKATELQPQLRSLGRAIKPSATEILENPRSRSAILRIAEKLL